MVSYGLLSERERDVLKKFLNDVDCNDGVFKRVLLHRIRYLDLDKINNELKLITEVKEKLI